jgi:hypothetical protein
MCYTVWKDFSVPPARTPSAQVVFSFRSHLTCLASSAKFDSTANHNGLDRLQNHSHPKIAVCFGHEMDEFHSFMRFLVAPLVLFIPMTPIISLLAILPGVQYGWVTHSLRMISINVVADELIRSMGWNDVRPRVIRVSNAMYDTLYPFYYADAWRLLMGFAAAARIIMEAYRISALDNIYMMYCNALVEAPNPSNPDIIGMGVRLSTYVLLLGVFASLFIGSFHSGPSGTKELGVATLISTSTLQDPRSASKSPIHVMLIGRRSVVVGSQSPQSRHRRLDAHRCIHRHSHDRHALRHLIRDSFVQRGPRFAFLCSTCHDRASYRMGRSPLCRYRDLKPKVAILPLG